MHHFTLRSSDGRTPLHAVMWQPQSEPVAVVQIAHGMIEYIERYDAFAQYLSRHGFLVVGHDHIGHGASIRNATDWGHFADRDGFAIVVDDLHVVRNHVHAKYPHTPYFLLGHSMGSFAVRTYLTRHAEGLSGALILGTGQHPAWQLRCALALGTLIVHTLGPRYRSRLLAYATTGALNLPFREEGQNAWLTRDRAVVEAYNHEPRCSFQFTAASYASMYRAMLALHEKQAVSSLPAGLPILLASGQADPLGGMGKRVRALYEAYKATGLRDVTLRLYPDCRHELLNELDRERVFADIHQWLSDHLPAQI